MKECNKCGFKDEDYGCICPHSDMWYACPIENKKPENIQALKEYAEWAYDDQYCANCSHNSDYNGEEEE